MQDQKEQTHAPIRVTIALRDGFEQVDGVRVGDYAGLAITPSLARGMAATRWNVTHIASGHRINARSFATSEEAGALIVRVGRLIDWTLDATAVIAAYSAATGSSPVRDL